MANALYYETCPLNYTQTFINDNCVSGLYGWSSGKINCCMQENHTALDNKITSCYNSAVSCSNAVCTSLLTKLSDCYAVCNANNVKIGAGASSNCFGIAVGYNSITSADFGVSIGFSNTAGCNGIAIGYNNCAYTDDVAIGTSINMKCSSTVNCSRIAIGNSACAYYKDSISIGTCSKSGLECYDAIAIGACSESEGIAIGANSCVACNTSIVIGCNVRTDSEYSVAIGNNITTACNNSVAVGSDAQAEEEHTVAVGKCAHATGSESIAIGYESYTNSAEGIAIGHSSSSGDSDAIAIGFNTCAYDAESIAFGIEAVACGESSIAIGCGACAESPIVSEIGFTSNCSIALGFNAKSYHSVAIGTNSCACVAHSIAIGCCACTFAIEPSKLPSSMYRNRVSLDIETYGLGLKAVIIGRETKACDIYKLVTEVYNYPSSFIFDDRIHPLLGYYCFWGEDHFTICSNSLRYISIDSTNVYIAVSNCVYSFCCSDSTTKAVGEFKFLAIV